MHHPTDRIAHTTTFVTPVVEHWLEREIALWLEVMDPGLIHSHKSLKKTVGIHLQITRFLLDMLSKSISNQVQGVLAHNVVIPWSLDIVSLLWTTAWIRSWEIPNSVAM